MFIRKKPSSEPEVRPMCIIFEQFWFIGGKHWCHQLIEDERLNSENVGEHGPSL